MFPATLARFMKIEINLEADITLTLTLVNKLKVDRK